MAPYVFGDIDNDNDNDNGTWIKEEVVVDSGAVGCVASGKRMPHLKSGRDTRVKTWRDADVWRRERCQC